MNIESLKIVVLVARHGSLAAAARAENLDPSSVSRIVASVEEEMGIRLFQRTTRRLAVTEEGQAYIARIGPLIEEFDHATEDARRSSQSPSGTLRMTASTAFAHECIAPHLGRFRGLYPDIAVELFATDTNLDILADRIDLAVRLAAAPKGDLISTRLSTTRYRVCASPGYLSRYGHPTHPRCLETLDCLRHLLPEQGGRWFFRRNDEDVFEVAVGGTVSISNPLSLRRAAVEGLGPALLADWLIRSEIRSGALVDVFPGYDCTATTFDTGAWALYPSRSFLPRKVRVTIDFLRACLSPT